MHSDLNMFCDNDHKNKAHSHPSPSVWGSGVVVRGWHSARGGESRGMFGHKIWETLSARREFMAKIMENTAIF